MMAAIVGGIAALAWFAIMIIALVYSDRIKKHRTDIASNQSPYHGKSHWLEINLLRSANYDKQGQSKVRILQILMLAQLIPMITLLYLYMRI